MKVTDEKARETLKRWLRIGACMDGKEDDRAFIWTMHEGVQAFLYLEREDGPTLDNMDAIHEMASAAGMDMQEAWGVAKRNTLERATVRPMLEALKSLKEELGDEAWEIEAPEGDAPQIHVLTSGIGCYGAGAGCLPEAVEKAMDGLGVDWLVMIPSSVHEWLVLPFGDEPDGGTMEKVTALVKEVNGSCVEPEEVLSDRAYKVGREALGFWLGGAGDGE